MRNVTSAGMIRPVTGAAFAERLRAAMGHADYNMLQKYVRLATERDLGRRSEWADYILAPSQFGEAQP